MTFLDIRNSVVDQIKAAFRKSGRIHIAAHPGNFDEAELRRLMQTTPAILTSLVGINDEDVADECYIDFVTWVLYRSDNKDRLYDGALSLVSVLVGIIKNLDNPASYGGGTKINAQCLYTGSLDKINATLWAVRWRLNARSVFSGGDIVLPDSMENFEGYDSSLTVGTQKADDTVDLD